jgi:phospholipid-translocating ATPase
VANVSFDATYLFEYTLLLLYNTVFTSLPVGILGAFDQDTNARAALAFPQLYKRGIQGLEYTRTRFWIYMIDGLYQSVMLFFIPYFAYGIGTTWSHGALDTNCLYDFGTTIAVAGVVSANSYVGINTRYWTVIPAVITSVSTLLIFIWIPIYSSLAVLPFSGEVGVIYPTFSFWAIAILTVFFCVGPRWLVVSIRQSYFPRDKDLVREAWITGDLKRQLGVRRREKFLDSERPVPQRTHSQRAMADERGLYEPAALASPQKDYSRSPATSAPASPLHFSYPPPSPLLNLGSTTTPNVTVPPPLLLRHSSEPAQVSPLDLHRMDEHTPPVSGLSYTSPSAVDAFNLTNAEIKRLSRASLDMTRASMSSDWENAVQKRESLSGGSPPLRRLSRDAQPRKQTSLPNPVHWDGLSAPARSPIRGSSEPHHSRAEEQEHGSVYEYGVRMAPSPVSQSPDFSVESSWTDVGRSTDTDRIASRGWAV